MKSIESKKSKTEKNSKSSETSIKEALEYYCKHNIMELEPNSDKVPIIVIYNHFLFINPKIVISYSKFISLFISVGRTQHPDLKLTNEKVNVRPSIAPNNKYFSSIILMTPPNVHHQFREYKKAKEVLKPDLDPIARDAFVHFLREKYQLTEGGEQRIPSVVIFTHFKMEVPEYAEDIGGYDTFNSKLRRLGSFVFGDAFKIKNGSASIRPKFNDGKAFEVARMMPHKLRGKYQSFLKSKGKKKKSNKAKDNKRRRDRKNLKRKRKDSEFNEIEETGKINNNNNDTIIISSPKKKKRKTSLK
eukprot:gb/GECH01005522.1/.p1 GENE.gb/GECH01005522.1/~~gb/GECH01005522.1/.p1  ORF type:complete len:302 (+),score=80.86 gb/GECH01005522.1/:1-906(+)